MLIATAIVLAGLAILLRMNVAAPILELRRTRGPVEAMSDVANLRDFGCVGNGVDEDTVAFYAAIRSGRKVVGVFGDTYLVSKTGSRTVNGVVQDYAISIPSGCRIDLNNATVKLADAANCAVFTNDNGATNIDLRNVIIDGNETNQTAPATGDMACVYFFNASKCSVVNITVNNARQYAGRFLQVSDSELRSLYCFNSDGDGWSFGIDGGYSAQVVRCKIDDVYAENCLQNYGSLQGNPAIFTAIDCQVGKVAGKNCAGGLKIQDTTANSAFDCLVFDGTSNGTANSGVKIQGNNAGLTVRGVQVDKIISKNCHSEGLYIFDADDVQIGSYYGNGNAVTSLIRDVLVEAGRVQIDSISSKSSAGYGVVLQGTGVYAVQSIKVHNCASRAVQIPTSCDVSIDTIDATDDRGGGALLTRILNVSGAGATGFVNTCRTNLANSTTEPRINIAAANYEFFIGKLIMGTDAPHGVGTFATGAATTTTVANSCVYRLYVGGAADYIHPIIEIIPIDSGARSLLPFGYTVTDMASGTGFTVSHASNSTAGRRFAWRVVGWAVHPVAPS